MDEQTKGAVTLALSVTTFAYFTFWLLVTPLLQDNPFVSGDLPLLGLFPPREWAISAMTLLGIVVLSAATGLIGWEMVSSQMWPARRT
mmetsp:Transcript_19918/g.55386  ORF Transcript_19918/g.55386 Transcript_19918/m.55386 type:complete len:88 (-) Transcript_19918:159-422(-)